MRFAGRRRSVERTTARCCRSACRRPEAGPLPSSASGRPRLVPNGRGSGVASMSRVRREPRTPYRIYSKEEFLAGADALTRARVAPAAWRDDTQRVGLRRGGEDRRGQRASENLEHRLDQSANRLETPYRPVRSRVVLVAVTASTVGLVGALVATVLRPARVEHLVAGAMSRQIARHVGFTRVTRKRPLRLVAIAPRPEYAGRPRNREDRDDGGQRSGRAMAQRSTRIRPRDAIPVPVDPTPLGGGQSAGSANASNVGSGRNGDFGFER